MARKSKSELVSTFADNRFGFTPAEIRNLLDSTVMHEEVVVTNAEALALLATPKVLIAAPGAGLAIIVDSLAIAKIGTGVYTEAADNLVVEYAGGTDIIAAIETTGFLDQATSQVRAQRPAVSVITPVANEAVELTIDGDAELGGGAAATTLKVTIGYHLIETT
jgi:hypothetical protein